IVSFSAELAARQLGENRAVARQAVAIDVTRRIPQLRAHDRFRALIENAIDGNDKHGAWRLAIDDEALRQRRIGRDCGTAVDANGLAAAWDEEQECNPRVVQNVSQGVDAVIAASVGNEQRFFVMNTNEARRIAARGAIEAFRTCAGQRKEWRRLDERAVMRGDAVRLLGDRRPIGLTIDALERVDVGNEVIAKFGHVRLRKNKWIISR